MFSELVYGNGKYLAIKFGPTPGPSVIYSSQDGITWSSHSFANLSDVNVNFLSFANNNFWLFGRCSDNSNFIASSSDGINWSFQGSSLIDQNLLANIKYLNGKYFVVGRTMAVPYTSIILTSNNSTDWVQVNNSIFNNYLQFGNIAYGNDAYVLLGNPPSAPSTRTSAVLKSTDGVSWTSIIDNFPTLLKRIIFADNKFVIVGSAYSNNNLLLWTSTDGSNWATTPQINVNMNNNRISLSNVIYSAGRFIAVGTIRDLTTNTSRALALVSKDGLHWDVNLVDNPANQIFNNVAGKDL